MSTKTVKLALDLRVYERLLRHGPKELSNQANAILAKHFGVELGPPPTKRSSRRRRSAKPILVDAVWRLRWMRDGCEKPAFARDQSWILVTDDTYVLVNTRNLVLTSAQRKQAEKTRKSFAELYLESDDIRRRYEKFDPKQCPFVTLRSPRTKP